MTSLKRYFGFDEDRTLILQRIDFDRDVKLTEIRIGCEMIALDETDYIHGEVKTLQKIPQEKRSRFTLTGTVTVNPGTHIMVEVSEPCSATAVTNHGALPLKYESPI
jgi:hypothetical protein